jgi:hypothetical protein
MKRSMKPRMKRRLAAGVIATAMLCAVTAAAQTPLPVLQNQLQLTEQALSINRQRQDDYKRRGQAAPDYLTKQNADLENRRRQIEGQMKRR